MEDFKVMKRFAKIATLMVAFVVVLAISVSAATMTIWSADTLDGSWGAAATELFADGGHNGVKATDAACPVVCWAPTEPVDISGYADGGITISLYISDVYAIEVGEGQAHVELSSNGGLSATYWEVSELVTTGWNDLTLNFADAASNSADLSSINYFRYFQYGTDLTIAVDEVVAFVEGEVVETEAEAAEEETEEEVVVETKEGIYNKLYISEEGTGSFKSSADIVAFASTVGPWDLTNYKDNGGVHILVYCADPAAIGNGQVELSSSGAPDAQEINWKFKDIELVEGWNDLYLDFNDVPEKEEWESRFGGMYWDAVNYCRIYFNPNTEAGVDMEIEIKDVYVYSTVELAVEETEATVEETEATTEKEEEAAQTSDAITVAVVVALVALAAASVVVFKKNRAL